MEYLHCAILQTRFLITQAVAAFRENVYPCICRNTPLAGFDVLSSSPWPVISLYSTSSPPTPPKKVCVYSHVDKNACSKRIEEIYFDPHVVPYTTCLHERSYSLRHATRLFYNYYLHA